MQFWYNVNPDSPWMNRCGLTSGKKSLVTAQNQTMIFLKKISRSPAEKRAGHRSRAGGVSRTSHQKKKKNPPPQPPNEIGDACHTQTELFIRLLLGFLAFFLLRFFEAPGAVLFRPKLGSDCSGAPSSLRLPTPPHNN